MQEVEGTGETLSYQYDQLNRLTQSASTAGWYQQYNYDGFVDDPSPIYAGGIGPCGGVISGLFGNPAGCAIQGAITHQ